MRTIEGSGTLNRYAVLRSPMLSKTGPNCALEFYYYMNETQYSWLSVFGIANSIQSRLFSTSSRTNGQWKRHLLWLGSRPSGKRGYFLELFQSNVYPRNIGAVNIMFNFSLLRLGS